MALSEYDQIEKTLRGLTLPEEVVHWDVELGVDWTDDPAAYITLVIADDVWSDVWLRDVGRRLRRQVSDAVLESGVASWPYLKMLTASDHQELLEWKSVK